MKFFASDTHLGHQRIIELADRPFNSVEEMNIIIINNIVSVLNKGDILYLVGDIAFNQQAFKQLLDKIPKGVDVHIILGNHDSRLGTLSNSKIKSVSNMKEIKIKGIHTTLCHYPMYSWNKSHYNAFMLFGHHHVNTATPITIGKMLNVNVEFHNYKPWSEDEVLEYMELQEDNFDYIKKLNIVNKDISFRYSILTMEEYMKAIKDGIEDFLPTDYEQQKIDEFYKSLKQGGDNES